MAQVTVPRSGRLALAFVATALILISGYFVKLSIETVENTHELIEAVDKTVENAIEASEQTEAKARDVHGNSDENMDLHKVYEIYTEDSWGACKTLKYGITAQRDFVTKDGNPRPEYQVPIYQSKKKYSHLIVKYEILYDSIQGRVAAKAIEQRLVNEYFDKFLDLPPEQKRPLPKK